MFFPDFNNMLRFRKKINDNSTNYLLFRVRDTDQKYYAYSCLYAKGNA